MQAGFLGLGCGRVGQRFLAQFPQHPGEGIVLRREHPPSAPHRGRLLLNLRQAGDFLVEARPGLRPAAEFDLDFGQFAQGMDQEDAVDRDGSKLRRQPLVQLDDLGEIVGRFGQLAGGAGDAAEPLVAAGQ